MGDVKLDLNCIIMLIRVCAAKRPLKVRLCEWRGLYLDQSQTCSFCSCSAVVQENRRRAASRFRPRHKTPPRVRACCPARLWRRLCPPRPCAGANRRPWGCRGTRSSLGCLHNAAECCRSQQRIQSPHLVFSKDGKSENMSKSPFKKIFGRDQMRGDGENDGCSLHVAVECGAAGHFFICQDLRLMRFGVCRPL